jgi:hypothetical protein
MRFSITDFTEEKMKADSKTDNGDCRRWVYELARAWRARISTMVAALLLRQARMSARMKSA